MFSLQSPGSANRASPTTGSQLEIRELLRTANDVTCCSPTVKPRAVGWEHQAVSTFPSLPGVYIFRDREGRPLYVGKAKSLDRRLRSYSRKARHADIKLSHLFDSTWRTEIIMTNTEAEALHLENRLIKQTKPRYNVLLRDDKAYPYVKLTVGGPNPQVAVTHQRPVDGTGYYGPFAPASLAHQIVRVIRRCFLFSLSEGRSAVLCATAKPIESREDKLEADKARACEAQAVNVRRIRRLLEGHIQGPVRNFARCMRHASNEQRFEKAALYRHDISVLKQLREHVNAARIPEDDTDIIGISRGGPWTAFTIFQFRHGRIVDRYDLIGKSRGRSSRSVLFPSLARWLYSSSPMPPAVVVPFSRKGRKIIGRRLSGAGTNGVCIRAPVAGVLRAWQTIADKNAQVSLQEWRQTSKSQAIPIRLRNNAFVRLCATPLSAQQLLDSDGRSGCKDQNQRDEGQSGPGRGQHFVAVRHSAYSFPTPYTSEHPFRRSTSAGDVPVSPAGNCARFEVAEFNALTGNPPDCEATSASWHTQI